MFRRLAQERDHPQVCTIGFEHDGAVPVRPRDTTAGAFISIENVCVGQVEDVSKTHGKYGV